MIPAEYDVGDAKWAFAIATRERNGEHLVMVSSWEGEDMNNLSCVTMPGQQAWDLAKALERASACLPADYPPGMAAWDVCPEVRSGHATLEDELFVVAWPGEDKGSRRRFEEVETLVLHNLPEGDPDYSDPKYTPVRAWAREGLRPTDTVITDVEQAELALKSATPERPVAVPVSIARALDWFPGFRYSHEAEL